MIELAISTHGSGTETRAGHHLPWRFCPLQPDRHARNAESSTLQTT